MLLHLHATGRGGAHLANDTQSSLRIFLPPLALKGLTCYARNTKN